MAVSLSGQPGKTHFWSNWHWNQWLGIFVLIILGCLNLIWPLHTLLLTISLLLFSIFIIRPFFSLALAILLMTFECVKIGWIIPGLAVYSFPIFFFVVILGLVCWYFSHLAGLSRPYQSTTLDLPLAIFWISGIIAMLWSSYFYVALGFVLSQTAGYLLFLLICAVNTNPKQVEKLFWLLFVLGILVVITTIISFFWDYKLSYLLTDTILIQAIISKFTGARTSLTGFMGHFKPIAIMLDHTIFIGLGLMCTRTSLRSRVFIYLGIMSMLFIHTLTQSRIDALGLFFGWLIFVYLNPQWRPKMLRQHLYMVVSVLIIFFTLFVILSALYDNAELIARVTGNEQTIPGYRFSAMQGRLDFARYALGELWATGGFGRGSHGIMPGFAPTAAVQSPSLYFAVLTDHGYGILSLILFGWIIMNLVVELRRALNISEGRYRIFLVSVCSALVAQGVAGIADHNYHIYDEWLVLGTAVATINGARWLNTSSSGTQIEKAEGT